MRMSLLLLLTTLASAVGCLQTSPERAEIARGQSTPVAREHDTSEPDDSATVDRGHIDTISVTDRGTLPRKPEFPPAAPPDPSSSPDSTQSVSSLPGLVTDIPDPATLQQMADASNQFGIDLYRRISAAGGNVFFSPASIYLALGMTSAGAAGTTGEQMADVLQFPVTGEELYRRMGALSDTCRSANRDDAIQLQIANRLWGQQGYNIRDSFQRVTREHFGAELERVNFTNSEAARQQINEWVSGQTHDRIPELLPSGSLDGDVRLVLTNAIYFKGQWTNPFRSDGTKDDDFHLAGGDAVKVPMMRRTGVARYGRSNGCQVLELTYGDGSLSMVVLLPSNPGTLHEIEQQLSAETLRHWVTAVKKNNDVDIRFPRFQLQQQLPLSNMLMELGMPDAFRQGVADFSGINGGRDLYIDQVYHQANVDVTEEGSEAAAATGVVAKLASFTIPDEFHADHPFLFVIRDTRSGLILFMGRVNDPR